MIGTTDGVLFLDRDAVGAPWRVDRRALEGKDVSSLTVEPSRGVIFAGTHGDFTEQRGEELYLYSANHAISGIRAADSPPRQGDYVYLSEDDGRTWRQSRDGIADPDVYALNCVQVGDEVRVYAGTEPAHLYVSKDFGESWQELPALRSVPSVDTWNFPAPPHVAHVKNINFLPGRPESLYVSIEQGGLLRSDDAGATFYEFTGFYVDVHRCVFPQSHEERLFITGGNGLYFSRDEGETWGHHEAFPIGYPDGLVIHPVEQDLMFSSGAATQPSKWPAVGTADSRIARSRDGGETWEVVGPKLAEPLRGNVEALSMHIWPGGYTLFGATGDGKLLWSDDGGESWQVITGVPPVAKGRHYRLLQGAAAAR
jgi:photosystem II stability/assembly factor-like uncharacterized protein